MLKIDYAIISNDQNPDYKNIFPFLRKRWNDLGVKTIYLDCYPDKSKYVKGEYHKESFFKPVDDFGNLECKVYLGPPDKFMNKYFNVMIVRFMIAGSEYLRDKVLVISDGDLVPINKYHVFCPSVLLEGRKFRDLLSKSVLVATDQYPNGNSLATFTYGFGSTFWKTLRAVSMSHIHSLSEMYSKTVGKLWDTDENFMNWRYQITDTTVKNTGNRIWYGQYPEISTLYASQIPYLKTPGDLAPFLELHNIRESNMTSELWTKFFDLLSEFDKLDVKPSNYYYPLIKSPWRDTIITKPGELILGDEWDDQIIKS